MDPQKLSFLLCGASVPCRLVLFSPSGPCIQRSLRSRPGWVVFATAPRIGVWQWLLARLPVARAVPGESTLLLLCLFFGRSLAVPSPFCRSRRSRRCVRWFPRSSGVLLVSCVTGVPVVACVPVRDLGRPRAEVLCLGVCASLLAVVLGAARSGTLCTCVFLRTRAV